MRNFHDTFETRKRSFMGAFSICMIAPLRDHLFSTFEKFSEKLTSGVRNVTFSENFVELHTCMG